MVFFWYYECMTSEAGYIIAIDGGGTSCRVAVANMQGDILGRSLQGAANIVSNVDGAVANITAGARAALAEAGLAHLDLASLPAFMGLAGVTVAGDLDEIGAHLPFSRSVFEDDAAIAMQGALGDDDGIVAILGTGSVYVGRQGEIMRRAGGWGFVVGDLGSGARLGRALLQDTLLAHDNIFTHSPLSRAVIAEFDDDPVQLVDFAQQETPGGFARFAPMVFEYAEQGDPIGRALVKGAVAHVDAALAAVTWPQCKVLCLMGGLAPFYRERIEPQFRAILREQKADALSGAVQLAVKRFGDTGAETGT